MTKPKPHFHDSLTCSNCHWHTGGHVGHCRRNSPGPRGFPIVYPLDWCGEYVAKGM
jgi:hypothetical protein